MKLQVGDKFLQPFFVKNSKGKLTRIRCNKFGSDRF